MLDEPDLSVVEFRLRVATVESDSHKSIREKSGEEVDPMYLELAVRIR